MIRLFVAIDLADDVTERLKSLSLGLPGARMVPREQMHLTLNFIGEVEGSFFLDIRKALAGVQENVFTLQLDGVGCFPPRGKPRVVWAGVAANLNLLRLQKKIRSVLVREAGLVLENRKYAPHITLARLNNTPSTRVGHFLQEYSLFQSQPFTVKHFSLYSSFLGKKGATHVVQESYLLRIPHSFNG